MRWAACGQSVRDYRPGPRRCMPQKPPGIPVTQAARVATLAQFHLWKPVSIFELHSYLVTGTSAYGCQNQIALAAIVNQAYSPDQRPLLRADPAAKPLFGSQLTLSDRFVRRRSSARITAGGMAHA